MSTGARYSIRHNSPNNGRSADRIPHADVGARIEGRAGAVLGGSPKHLLSNVSALIRLMARTIFTDKDASERDLVLYGRDHILAARTLAETHAAHFYDSAAFLYHLGLEMFLKAILLRASRVFPDEHKLERIANKINMLSHNAIPCEVLSAYRKLDQFWQIKYPDRKAPIEVGDQDFEFFEDTIKKTWLLLPDGIIRSVIEPQHIEGIEHPVFEKGGRVLFDKPLDQ